MLRILNEFFFKKTHVSKTPKSKAIRRIANVARERHVKNARAPYSIPYKTVRMLSVNFT